MQNPFDMFASINLTYDVIQLFYHHNSSYLYISWTIKREKNDKDLFKEKCS